jgi:hypothetical protein
MTVRELDDLAASCRARVQALVDADVSMAVVQRTIEASALSAEEKSELWLEAWSRLDASFQDAGEGDVEDSGPRDLDDERAVVGTSSGLLGHD